WNVILTLEMSELPHFVFYVRMTIEEIPYVELTLSLRFFASVSLSVPHEQGREASVDKTGTISHWSNQKNFHSRENIPFFLSDCYFKKSKI
ncbi:hypothetical protein, partial [Leptospira santarosai]|uniref:hypothetical protein n=1 Tax=Leptospira santarosai TaxID=28183 RepID=UPI000B30FCBB